MWCKCGYSGYICIETMANRRRYDLYPERTSYGYRITQQPLEDGRID
ncbi:hypothetical protein [Paenibacillus alvei]|nr:hypothetical protein [Paenibacillus alvei]